MRSINLLSGKIFFPLIVKKPELRSYLLKTKRRTQWTPRNLFSNNCLNDAYKFESSQKDESRTRQDIPQTACCKARARLVTFSISFQLFPEVPDPDQFSNRFVYKISQSSVVSLSSVFREMEEAKQELGIEEYSFSQSTLEQVGDQTVAFTASNNLLFVDCKTAMNRSKAT